MQRASKYIKNAFLEKQKFIIPTYLLLFKANRILCWNKLSCSVNILIAFEGKLNIFINSIHIQSSYFSEI